MKIDLCGHATIATFSLLKLQDVVSVGNVFNSQSFQQ